MSAEDLDPTHEEAEAVPFGQVDGATSVGERAARVAAALGRPDLDETVAAMLRDAEARQSDGQE